MKRSQKITLAASGLVVVGLAALAGPSIAAAAGELFSSTSVQPEAAAATQAPEPEIEPTGDPMRDAAQAIGCDDFATVGGYNGAPRPDDRPDMGESDLAAGTVTYNADGTAATYTVAEGDAGEAIGERFCVDYVTLLVANDAWPTIHPGDVLRINPVDRSTTEAPLP